MSRLPPNPPFKSNSQASRLYRRLEHYPEITRPEIQRMQMDMMRLREIRKFLRDKEMDIRYDRKERTYTVVGPGA